MQKHMLSTQFFFRKSIIEGDEWKIPDFIGRTFKFY